MSEENLPQQEMTEINGNELFQQRVRKAEEMIAAGINPFGERFDGDTRISRIREAYRPDDEAPQHVIAAGRMTAMRVMGKSIFADVRDSSGRMQFFVGKNEVGEEEFAFIKKLDIGDIIGVEGDLFVTRTGELTIRTSKLTLLCKSLRPLPEKFHGLTDVEQRYRQRYLDLITNDASREVFQKRCRIISELRRFMESRGFMEVETPMLQHLAGEYIEQHAEGVARQLLGVVVPPVGVENVAQTAVRVLEFLPQILPEPQPFGLPAAHPGGGCFYKIWSS